MGNGIKIPAYDIKVYEETVHTIVGANSYNEINTTVPLTIDDKKIMGTTFICNLDAIVCSFSTSAYAGLKLTVANTAPLSQAPDIIIRAIYI